MQLFEEGSLIQSDVSVPESLDIEPDPNARGLYMKICHWIEGSPDTEPDELPFDLRLQGYDGKMIPEGLNHVTDDEYDDEKEILCVRKNVKGI